MVIFEAKTSDARIEEPPSAYALRARRAARVNPVDAPPSGVKAETNARAWARRGASRGRPYVLPLVRNA